MSQILKENEKLDKKKVLYTGTDTLKLGSNLCYNADAIRSAEETFGKITGAALSAKTAADVYNSRAWEVEKPAVGNLKDYAGVLVEEYAGVTGPTGVEIYVPKARGQKVEVLSDVANVIGVTVLTLQAGSYAAGGNGEGPSIGVAVQTVDRSDTEGSVQANLIGLDHENQIGSVMDVNSRSTVELPTAAIWDNFDKSNLLLDIDFKQSTDLPNTTFLDTSSLLAYGASVLGEYTQFATADNEAAEGQYNVPIKVSGAGKWAFECRVKVSEVSAAQNNALGLMKYAVLAGDQIDDNGALADIGFIGFQKKEGDPNVYDLVYDINGQAQNEHDEDYVTITAAYVTLGLYFNGTTIQGYLNGVATGTAISASDIAAADFPTGEVFLPTLLVKNGNAADYTVTYDWLRVSQISE